MVQLFLEGKNQEESVHMLCLADVHARGKGGGGGGVGRGRATA